jgi:hypothetical protein
MEEKIERRLKVLTTQLQKDNIHFEDKKIEIKEKEKYFVEENKTCGIVCYIGKENAFDYLMEGLKILQNRGYDSAGICTIGSDTNELIITKFASVSSNNDAIPKLEKTASIHKGNKVGIAHTR